MGSEQRCVVAWIRNQTDSVGQYGLPCLQAMHRTLEMLVAVPSTHCLPPPSLRPVRAPTWIPQQEASTWDQQPWALDVRKQGGPCATGDLEARAPQQCRQRRACAVMEGGNKESPGCGSMRGLGGARMKAS
jgi:hypothetical protein